MPFEGRRSCSQEASANQVQSAFSKPSCWPFSVCRHLVLYACSAFPGWVRVPPFPAGCVFRHSRLDARRPAGHGKRYKNSIEGRLSFSRALTRYKNRVQSVLCHSKCAGHVAKKLPQIRSRAHFQNRAAGHSLRAVIWCCMRVLSFPAGCAFRRSRLHACSAIPG